MRNMNRNVKVNDNGNKKWNMNRNGNGDSRLNLENFEFETGGFINCQSFPIKYETKFVLDNRGANESERQIEWK